uniref:LEM domain-containing protein n=1 Tax=Syphacia muris TaxID=451379 RepID=A0A158R5G0_9BILA
MAPENSSKELLHQLAAISSTSSELTIRYLLSTGQCHVNDQNVEGSTALHIAARADNYDICKLLLSFGADLFLPDNSGRTAYNLAVGKTRRYFRSYIKCSDKSKQTKFNTLTRLFRTFFSCVSGVNELPDRFDSQRLNQYNDTYSISNDGHCSPRKSVVPMSLSKNYLSDDSMSTILASTNSSAGSFVTARESGTFSNYSTKSSRYESFSVVKKPALPRIDDEHADVPVTYAETFIPTCFSQHLTDDSDSSADSDEVTLSEVTASIMKMSDRQLRQELVSRGVNVGPLLPSTRRVYERKLARLMSNIPTSSSLPTKRYSTALEEAIAGDDFYEVGRKLDNELIHEFLIMSRRMCRENKKSTSFCYLLLDPLVIGDSATCNLEVFLKAVFYVGKGKRSRPFEHLVQAIRYKQQHQDGVLSKASVQESNKLDMINAIWSRGHGVVSLSVFQNTIPIEAFTREAAMIDAIGLENLTNCRRGDYYGASKGWTYRQKTIFGTFLLIKAMNILHIEGCRQLFEYDVAV